MWTEPLLSEQRDVAYLSFMISLTAFLGRTYVPVFVNFLDFSYFLFISFGVDGC